MYISKGYIPKMTANSYIYELGPPVVYINYEEQSCSWEADRGPRNAQNFMGSKVFPIPSGRSIRLLLQKRPHTVFFTVQDWTYRHIQTQADM